MNDEVNPFIVHRLRARIFPMQTRSPYRIPVAAMLALSALAALAVSARADGLDPKVLKIEADRIAAIEKVRPAVVSVFAPGGQGGGSGVLIDADGYVLTNFHVVAGRGPAGANPHMQCGLSDGVLYDAVLVGIDKVGDVAMIQLQPKKDKDGKVIAPKGGKFPFAQLGDSDKVRAGDWSMAMGNPFLLATDFNPTVTFGLVSGVHRYQYPEGKGLLEYTDCIQMDTSINPGNSGGPLFNMQGELIGINGRGSFEKRGRVNSGVGYAISINQIKNFMGHLRAGLDTDHASTGFRVGEREEDGAARLTVTVEKDECEARRMGISEGDVIISFAGRPMESVNHYKNIVGIFPRGWRMPLKYRHDNETRETLLRLEGAMAREVPDANNKPPAGPQPPAAPPAALPKEVADKYQAKAGYANFHFNKKERDRLLKTFVANNGDFAGLTGTWTIAGDAEIKKEKTTVEFKIGEEKDKEGKAETTVHYAKGGIADLYKLQPFKTGVDPEEMENPPDSGGLLTALTLYRQMLALGEKGFPGDGFAHGGFEPFYLPTDAPKPDFTKQMVECEVLTTKFGPIPAKWYFSKKDATLLGGEVYLKEGEKNPCELYFTYGDKKDANGRKVPQKIEVRYGKDRYALITVTTFDCPK
jgi:S1-C subfamily serine protease